ncbi:Membrane protein, clustering with ActP [Caballeronia sordidicola]|uniref:Membrane protein, clustering with ActP n=2 Tax=Caballeronia sordidicola TaxID=196367 RepID=A0A226WZM5_CABSO|nr:Membrane protein, clustering with ActP [Caballeronia sordidicola]
MEHGAPTYLMSDQYVAAEPPPPAANPLLEDARFVALVRARRKFSWTLTILMLTVYFAFILTLAFAPALLGRPIIAGYPATWGIPVGFGMFVFTFVLVAIYVVRANTTYDRAVNEIRQGVQP